MLLRALIGTFALLLGSFVHAAQPQCCFYIPKDWNIVHGKRDTPLIVRGISSEKGSFIPSINLSFEKIHGITPKQYVDAVHKMSLREPQTIWRELGPLAGSAEQGLLIEMENRTEREPILLRQCLFFNEECVYVLTAGVSKGNWVLCAPLFEKMFTSFTFTQDLFSLISSPSLKETLESRITALKSTWSAFSGEKKTNPLDHPVFFKEHWDPFESWLENTFDSLGKYWQFLISQCILESLTSGVSDEKSRHFSFDRDLLRSDASESGI